MSLMKLVAEQVARVHYAFRRRINEPLAQINLLIGSASFGLCGWVDKRPAVRLRCQFCMDRKSPIMCDHGRAR